MTSITNITTLLAESAWVPKASNATKGAVLAGTAAAFPTDGWRFAGGVSTAIRLVYYNPSKSAITIKVETLAVVPQTATTTPAKFDTTIPDATASKKSVTDYVTSTGVAGTVAVVLKDVSLGSIITSYKSASGATPATKPINNEQLGSVIQWVVPAETVLVGEIYSSASDIPTAASTILACDLLVKVSLPAEDNTLLYIGIGALVVVAIVAIVYFSMGSPPPPPPPPPQSSKKHKKHKNLHEHDHEHDHSK